MHPNKKRAIAMCVVAMLLGVGLAVFVPTDEEVDAAVGDGGTYSYTITYDPSVMTTTSAAISVADMTPISHTSSTTFESLNKGSWTWNTTTGVGPFNSFYGAFDINDGNKFVGILNPENLGQLIDGTTLSSLGGHYNIMWVLPTVYWSASGNTLTLTNDPNGGTAYAHTIDGHVYNYIAIGVYEASTATVGGQIVLTSESGVMPLVSQSRVTCRTYAHNYTMDSSLGEYTYSMQWNFYQWELYKYCSLTVMEDFNSQNTVGNGYAYGSTSTYQTGTTDSMGPYAGNSGPITDATSATNYGSNPVKLFIENSWGGVLEHVDGVVVNNRQGFYIDTKNTPTDTSTTGPNVTYVSCPLQNNFGGYPTSISTQTQSWGYGTNSGGSATTGLADSCYAAQSPNRTLKVGGHTYDDASSAVGCGLFNANSESEFTTTYDYLGSRLAFVFDEDPVLSYTATIESNNTSYGTVSTASITAIEPGTEVTISQDGLTLTIGSFGSSVAIPAAQTVQYDYSFTGWYDGSTLLQTGDTINSDMTITATFAQDLRPYTITFAAGSGGTVAPSTITADYGTAITTNSNVVTIGSDTATATPNSSTPQYNYTFDSWTNATGTVDGDRTITANFTATVNTYSVTVSVDPVGAGTLTGSPFPNEDYGTAITTNGMTLTIGGDTMTAAVADPTAQYTYSWVGWFIGDTEIEEGTTITGTTAITAKFLATTNQYTITWITGYSTIREKYDYGATPSIEDPVRAGYYFTGWDPAVVPVTGDATYTATYTAANFILNFSNGNGSKQPVGQYYYSDVDETHTFTITDDEPTWIQHEFTGWSTTKYGAVEYVAGDEITVNVDEPVTLYAVWERTGGGEVIGNLIDLIPLLIVVGLVLGVVGMFVWKKYY